MRNNFKDYAHTFCQLCAHYAHLFGFVLHTIVKTTFINETDYAVSAISDSDVTLSSAPGGKITHGAPPRLAIYIRFCHDLGVVSQVVSKKNKSATGNIR